MRKLIIIISLILFATSTIKAKNDLFATSSTLVFSNKKESLEIEIVYNNDDDIWLYAKYDKPIIEPKFEDGIYQTTSVLPKPNKLNYVTIHFWLNTYDGAKQNYIYINIINGIQSKHKISKIHYDAIASNLHSVSVGNKWKLVKKNESYKVREYFIEQLIECKNREVNVCKYLIRQADAKNEVLENANKTLANQYSQILIENTQLKTELQKANEQITLRQKSTSTIVISKPTENKKEVKKDAEKDIKKVTKKEVKKDTKKEIEHKPKKIVVTYEESPNVYTNFIKITEDINYVNNGKKLVLEKGSILEIEVKGNVTHFSVLNGDVVTHTGTITTKSLRKSCINVKKVATEI